MADRGPSTHAAAAEQHHGTALNRWLAAKITAAVGTMTCAYLFTALALYGLPDAIASGSVPNWFSTAFLQLVLLSVIMVGQNVAAIASDARSQATFDDVTVLIEQNKQIIQLLGARP